MPFRFNHMELTFPRGTLDAAARKDIGAFYGEMFNWSGFDVELFKQTNFILTSDDAAQSFILLAEADKHITSPGYDHLGILCDTREEVNERLEIAKRWREKDDRVDITEFLFSNDPGLLLLQSATDEEVQARHEAYLADMARYRAETQAAEEAQEAALWRQLGEKPAAIVSIKPHGMYELAITVLGHSAEAVAAITADYERRYPAHVHLTRFDAPFAWQHGFKATGTRRESI